MQGFELNEFFNQYPILQKHYQGIFAINTLPKILKFRHFLICNTDQSSGSGEHWFCFLRNSKSSIECFDSLGINAEKKAILQENCKFRGIKSIEFNESQFQSNSSDSCGLFTLYFIFERMHNLDLTFNELLEEIFEPENFEKNEEKVVIFCDKLKNEL